MNPIPLQDQLSCARRELALRRNTYPKWVAQGRMKQASADIEIARQEAIVGTLEKMVHLDEVSRQIVGGGE